MKKFILSIIFLSGLLYATDYSSMSTEDLINLRGSVPAQDRTAFRSELQSRISAMSTSERESLGIGNAQGSGSGTQTRKRMQNMNGSGMGGGMGNMMRSRSGRR